MKSKSGRTLQHLWHRFSPRRILRFGLVGIVGVAVNYLLLWALVSFILGEELYLLGAAVGIEASIINNFVWNDVWTFRDRLRQDGWLVRLAKFHGSRLLGLLAGLLALYVFTDILGIYYLVSNAFSIMMTTLVNYLTSDLWVWAEK